MSNSKVEIPEGTPKSILMAVQKRRYFQETFGLEHPSFFDIGTRSNSEPIVNVACDLCGCKAYPHCVDENGKKCVQCKFSDEEMNQSPQYATPEAHKKIRFDEPSTKEQKKVVVTLSGKNLGDGKAAIIPMGHCSKCRLHTPYTDFNTETNVWSKPDCFCNYKITDENKQAVLNMRQHISGHNAKLISEEEYQKILKKKEINKEKRKSKSDAEEPSKEKKKKDKKNESEVESEADPKAKPKSKEQSKKPKEDEEDSDEEEKAKPKPKDKKEKSKDDSDEDEPKAKPKSKPKVQEKPKRKLAESEDSDEEPKAKPKSKGKKDEPEAKPKTKGKSKKAESEEEAEEPKAKPKSKAKKEKPKEVSDSEDEKPSKASKRKTIEPSSDEDEVNVPIKYRPQGAVSENPEALMANILALVTKLNHALKKQKH